MQRPLKKCFGLPQSSPAAPALARVGAPRLRLPPPPRPPRAFAHCLAVAAVCPSAVALPPAATPSRRTTPHCIQQVSRLPMSRSARTTHAQLAAYSTPRPCQRKNGSGMPPALRSGRQAALLPFSLSAGIAAPLHYAAGSSSIVRALARQRSAGSGCLAACYPGWSSATTRPRGRRKHLESVRRRNNRERLITDSGEKL